MKSKTLDLEQFIAQLNDFAAADFPLEKTHHFLAHSLLGKGVLSPYVFFSDQQYTRNLVHKSEDFELLAICWQPGQQAPIHGHEGEKCWSRVEQGRLRFTTYVEVGSEPLELKLLSDLEVGPGHLDGPADIHAVQNTSGEPAVSLHIYSKPYDACDIYDLETGRKQRKKLSYHTISGRRV